MKRTLASLLSLFIVCFLGASSSPAQQPAPKTVAVKAARALDVRTGSMINNAVIVIEGDHIKEFGANVSIPASAEVIDLGSKTVLPGLIDCHTHLTFEPSQMGYSSLGISVPRSALTGAKNARLTIEAGFTTVRNVGATGYADIALRDAINAGDVPGPRILASGPALGITGGHCDNNLLAPEFNHVDEGVADGVSAVMRKTREVIKYGADVIKICSTGGVLSLGDDPKASQYTLEEMKTIVAEAHRLGRKVAAHAHGGDGIKLAVLAGVDSIEHGSYIDDEAVKLMKERGVYLVPTLYLGDWFLENYQRMGVPAPMAAKGKADGRERQRGHAGGPQEHRARLCAGRAGRFRHGLGGLPARLERTRIRRLRQTRPDADPGDSNRDDPRRKTARLGRPHRRD